MNRPHFFSFYPADFANDINVEAMSTLQVGAYLLLLCKAWQADPPASLPNDDVVLARFARVELALWQEIKSGILSVFKEGTDGRLHNKRLRKEYDKALQLIRAKSTAGTAGANARWQSHDRRMTEPLPTQCDRNANQSKNQSQKEEEIPPNPPAGGGTSKPPKFDPSSIPIPSELQSASFAAAWKTWLEVRTAPGAKGKPTEHSIKAQFRKLMPLGPERAAECLNESIANGWQGLFPEKFTETRGSHGNTRTSGGQPHRVDSPPGKYPRPAGGLPQADLAPRPDAQSDAQPSPNTGGNRSNAEEVF